MLPKKINYLVAIILTTSWSIFLDQKLLAENLTRPKVNNQSLAKIKIKNQCQNKLDSWLGIIKKKRDNLSSPELALIESKLADCYFQRGSYGAAVRHWRSAIEINRADGQERLLATNLSDVAVAYLSLGQTLLAEKTLKEAIVIAEQEQLKNILYSAYMTLGSIYQLQGKYLEAENNLNNSLKYAVKEEEKVAANHNLSQVFYAQSQKLLQRIEAISAEELDSQEFQAQAKDYWERSWLTTSKAISLGDKIKSLVVVEAYLQMLKLGSEIEDFNRTPYLSEAEKILSLLPPSTRKVYALIGLSDFSPTPEALLTSALSIAENLEDNRSVSLAQGHLGAYYEQNKQYHQALEWTNQAIAQTQTDDKNLYRWYWQKGRIYNSLGQTQPATGAYYQAIASLQGMRAELARSTAEQLDFASEIEPVYRELLQLLLSGNPASEQIEQALDIRDLLQLSELENFFGDDCLELVEREELPPESKTGAIYTIILPDATHVIFKQGKQSKIVKIDMTQAEIEALIGQWRYSLEDRTEENYLSLSQKMYDLLIEPIKAELIKNQLETLIFVGDGIFKNVPMAALHDGQKFLVEDYAIVASLSLNLKIKEERFLHPITKVLAFGLSEQTANLPPLPYVRQELESIGNLVEVKQFLDSEFTLEALEQELISDNFPLVHFATHSQFAGTLEDSFLSTYDERVSLTTLEKILNRHQLKFPERTIDLLILSACETAAGNKRATLGLAGVALRSGVRNVIGSLWSVNDDSEVELIEKIYDNLLGKGLTPPQALRQAQSDTIDTFHPAIWSNLILIAN